jgi:hypothetical protein
MNARDEAGLAQQVDGGDMVGAHHGTVDEPGEGEVLPRQADRRVDSGLTGVLVGRPVAAQDLAERDGGAGREPGGAKRPPAAARSRSSTTTRLAESRPADSSALPGSSAPSVVR